MRFPSGYLVLEKERVVDAFGHENSEEDDEDELDKLEDLLEHHDREAMLLVVIIHFGEE